MSGVTTDFDPIVLKALGYFWSKSPDSTAKLKKMLDDAIEQNKKKQEAKSSTLDKMIASKPQKQASKIMKSGPSHDLKKKEKEIAQRRQFERVQKDLEELNHEVAKKPRMDRSSSPSIFTSVDKMSPKHSILAQDTTEPRGSPATSTDDKDFSMDIDGLACVICNVASIEQGNTPVECQECHSMYHRECHQPPISYQDANDPRCIWYCVKCMKNMKKVAKQNISRSTNAVVSNVAMRERQNSFDSKNKSAFVTPFKRNEIKTTISSSNNGGGGSLQGWAALRGKPVSQPQIALKSSAVKSSLHGPVKTTSITSHKDKRDKLNKGTKTVPKLSDAWAEALGADVPATPNLPKTSTMKSVTKNPSWGSAGSSKSSVFPKIAATSVPSTIGKSSMSIEARAMKKLDVLKKKVKINPKKSKI